MTGQTTIGSCCAETTSTHGHDAEHGGESDPSNVHRMRELVRERYAKAATEKDGCGCGCNGEEHDGSGYSFVGEEYAGREGYVEDADLGLGCGVPTDIAGIREGDTVLDLGSGAGIDAFIARKHVGQTGEVIGVDFTPEMIDLAKANARKLDYPNVRFVLGDIEDLPIPQRSVDVAISNCVLNLVPDKLAAFSEMYRVLKPGGRFAVSDIVILGDLPERLRDSAALYAGCVSGAIGREEYLRLLATAGFSDVRIARERLIAIPDAVLLQVASLEDVQAFNRSGGIASVTVTGVRPE